MVRCERAVCNECTAQLLLSMQRADLDPDTGLVFGHDRIEESHDINAVLEQLLGELVNASTR